MWNNLHPHLQATGQTPPRGNAQAPPQPGTPPPRFQPTGQTPPQPASQAAPPPQQPGPQGGGIEPAVANVLVQRAKSLTPQESQTFFDGITVPALTILKKILPEIAPAIDQAIAKKQGGAAGAPAGAAPQSAPPIPAPQAQAAPAQPPASGLRGI